MIPTRIMAMAVATNHQQSYDLIYVQTMSDSTGTFSIEVPVGSYILRMDASSCYSFYANGMLVAGSDAETLVVGRGESVSADLSLGAARIEVTLPAELEGHSLAGRLEPLDSPSCTNSSKPVPVVGGHASLTFTMVRPGAYRVILDLSDLGSILLPGTTVTADADTIVVRAGAERFFTATLPEPATFRGTVTGSWQELGQSPPQLSLVDLDGQRSCAGGKVNPSDGSFSFPLYGRARFHLQIVIGSTVRWQGGDGPETATVFDIAPGETVTLNLRDFGVAGWLNRESTGLRTTLMLYDRDHVWHGTCEAEGPQGFFRLSNLVPGSYYLHIAAGPTWIEQWHERADSLADATPILVTEDRTIVWVNPDLEDGGRIEGYLRRGDGTPAYGVRISLYTAASDYAIRSSVSTGDGGAFAFTALPDGEYRLTAIPHESQAPFWYPGVIDPAQAESIVIRGHAQITGLHFGLP